MAPVVLTTPQVVPLDEAVWMGESSAEDLSAEVVVVTPVVLRGPRIIAEWAGCLWHHRRRPHGCHTTHLEGEAALLVVIEQYCAVEATLDEGIDESDLCTRCERLHLFNYLFIEQTDRAHIEADITGMTASEYTTVQTHELSEAVRPNVPPTRSNNM